VPVVLVSIDTLRPDHLGVYGYPRPTSPAIDAFARDAVVFDDAVSHAPSTLPSHASLFTSLLPSEHGASFARRDALRTDVATLADTLTRAGWRSAGFHEGAMMHPRFGLGRGFERYAQPGQRGFAAVVAQARPWLEAHAARPFFLFLHTYEVHHPYEPLARDLARFDGDYHGALPDTIPTRLLQRINDGEVALADGDLAHIIAAYDGGIRGADRAFGALVAMLRALDLYERSLVIVTSDHGEEFGEHGRVGWHSHTLYDELLRVPLLIKWPASLHAGTRVAPQVRLIDVAPTVLATLGVATPAGFRGRDLAALVAGASERRPALSQRDRTGSLSLRADGWKLYRVLRRGSQLDLLFDLAHDPGETKSVAATQPERLEAMRRELDALAHPHTEAPAEAPVELDDAARRRLEALGYL